MDPSLLFTWITTQIDNALQTGVQQNYAALISAIRPVVAAGLILWLAAASAAKLAGWNQNSIGTLFKGTMIGAGVLTYCFAEANYGSWARDGLMNGLAKPLMAVMAGAGGHPITGNAFDGLVAKTVVTGLTLFKTVGMSPVTWIMLGVVPLYFGISLFSICAAFLVWLLPHVILQLLVSIGPIFCAFAAFAITRSIFHSWMRTCLSMVMLQLLLFALLTIVLAADTTVTQRVMALAESGVDAGASEIGQLVGAAFGAAAVNLLLGFASICLPAVAAAVTNGAYVNPMGAASAAGGAINSAAGQAAAAAARSGGTASAPASAPVGRTAANFNFPPPSAAIWRTRP